ncbi:hypothetical protein GGR54DRAFT_352399 [Hypoxylon sp. NC1633]|nr:hypothetical protein GGR54DRAFT_352399 [Hypoxylon sp. NC1633]
MVHLLKSWIATVVCVAAAVAAATVADPTCQKAAAPWQATIHPRTANASMPGTPFGILYARDNIAFVGMGHSVGMLNTAEFKPALARLIALPAPMNQSEAMVSGLALSRNKRYVYASIGIGAAIVDVEKAIAGEANPVVGLLKGTTGDSAIEVTPTADNSYVFVTQEYGTNMTRYRGTIEVFQLHRGPNGSMTSTNKGSITLGYSVVGTELSHDGSKLYVTSEVTGSATSVNETRGTLSILDVATLKTNPSKALIRTIDAGCSPVRLTFSPDGKLLWVTARESNKLLAFDVAKLQANHSSSHALEASVQVGTSPVGMALVKGDRYIITADSDRYSYANATTGLTVVDTEAALMGKQGFPRILTGLFPRELAVSPDGKTLLVSQYLSRAIQAINLTQLDAATHARRSFPKT